MNSKHEILQNRSIITLSGPDAKKLLQGVITNNVESLKNGNAIYSALLTPQGKFLHDFFLFELNDTLYLDCEKDRSEDLFRRLLMYRLRTNVEISDESENYSIAVSTLPFENEELSFHDPRNPSLGFRAIVSHIETTTNSTYHLRRIKLGIAEGSDDFLVDKSTILEGHFEQINGVDFSKGCYVGQEVTARMKYRGKIKKAMLPIKLTGKAPAPDTDILNEKGNKIGVLRSSCDNYAIGLFRLSDVNFDEVYSCGDINITIFKPEWMEIDG